MAKKSEDYKKFDEVLDNEEYEKLGESDKAIYLIRQGIPREDIHELHGINKNTVRTVWSNMKNAGELPKGAKISSKKPGLEPGEEPPGTPPAGGTKLLEPPQVPTTLKVATGKPAPPEVLIRELAFDGMPQEYEKGLKTGLSMLVLAVRVVQELSTIGVQQTAPMIQMAKEMRTGEAEMVKATSEKSAYDAAGQVMERIGPMLNVISQGINARPVSENPFRDMIARQMEPIFGQMMQGVMGGLLGGGQLPLGQLPPGQQPSDQASRSTPLGWQEEEELIEE